MELCQSCPNAYSEKRQGISSHSRKHGQGWSGRAGASLRTSSTEQRADNPTHKLQPPIPCGAPGYRSTHRPVDSPDSRACSGREPGKGGHTSPIRNPIEKKGTAQDQIGGILQALEGSSCGRPVDNC